jgi:hypothetical protein
MRVIWTEFEREYSIGMASSDVSVPALKKSDSEHINLGETYPPDNVDIKVFVDSS